MRSRILHVGIAKWLLLDLLSAHGAGSVLTRISHDRLARFIVRAGPALAR